MITVELGWITDSWKQWIISALSRTRSCGESSLPQTRRQHKWSSPQSCSPSPAPPPLIRARIAEILHSRFPLGLRQLHRRPDRSLDLLRSCRKHFNATSLPHAERFWVRLACCLRGWHSRFNSVASWSPCLRAGSNSLCVLIAGRQSWLQIGH